MSFTDKTSFTIYRRKTLLPEAVEVHAPRGKRSTLSQQRSDIESRKNWSEKSLVLLKAAVIHNKPSEPSSRIF